MAIEAIDNARRKAGALAKKVNKKVGGILNVEAKDTTTIKISDHVRNSSKYTFKYSLSITFELLD